MSGSPQNVAPTDEAGIPKQKDLFADFFKLYVLPAPKHSIHVTDLRELIRKVFPKHFGNLSDVTPTVTSAIKSAHKKVKDNLTKNEHEALMADGSDAWLYRSKNGAPCVLYGMDIRKEPTNHMKTTSAYIHIRKYALTCLLDDMDVTFEKIKQEREDAEEAAKDFHANGSCKKEFLFSLVLYHALIFSLEWVAAGVTMGKGYTYFHSMSHWFDPEDAVPVWASDEMGEQGNSTRKLSAGRVGSGKQFERGQHRFESARKKSFKKIPTPSQKEDDVPRIFAYSYLKICKRCFTRNNTWRTNLDYLVQRVKRCGFDGHVTTQEGTNDILFSADSNNHQCFKLCVCGKRKWDIPSRASEYISE